MTSTSEFIPDAFKKLVKGEITADVYVEDLKRRVERDKRRFGPAAIDAGGYCGKHGLFTGRVCPGCNQETERDK